jgi:hypothetical protein
MVRAVGGPILCRGGIDFVVGMLAIIHAANLLNMRGFNFRRREE